MLRIRSVMNDGSDQTFDDNVYERNLDEPAGIKFERTSSWRARGLELKEDMMWSDKNGYSTQERIHRFGEVRVSETSSLSSLFWIVVEPTWLLRQVRNNSRWRDVNQSMRLKEVVEVRGKRIRGC
jgi:hypothetical protein